MLVRSIYLRSWHCRSGFRVDCCKAQPDLKDSENKQKYVGFLVVNNQDIHYSSMLQYKI